jgi:nucleotide-binding universal stress UspA family protein
MFNEIVVGVDEHGYGRDAIALAQSMASNSARLTLAYVVTTEPYVLRGASARYAASEPAGATDRREEEQARELLELAREHAQRDEQGREFTVRCVRSASVGRGLHELAETDGADLLVLGSARRGLLGRVLVGDDTHAALNGAPCAVAIAPAGFSELPPSFREIGVGYDGSPESAYALEIARELAAAWGARLSALTAVSVPSSGFGELPRSDAVNRLVRDARVRIESLGGVEAHAVYGAPVEELSVYSASLDLLVVGSRGYGPIGRLIHGTTSGRIARTARCALLVVPASSRRRIHATERAVVGAEAGSRLA